MLIGAWIKFGLHFGVSWVFAPLKKIIDSPLRAIAIPDNEREVFLGELPLHGFKGLCRGLAEDTLWREITANGSTDEVMGSCIADVLHNRRIDIAQIDKAFGLGGVCDSQVR